MSKYLNMTVKLNKQVSANTVTQQVSTKFNKITCSVEGVHLSCD